MFSDASHNAFANATGQNCIAIYLDLISAVTTFWSKREQKVTDSSSESEAIAAHHLIKEGEFIRGYLDELGEPVGIPKAYCDNESVCQIANQRFLKNAGRNKYFRRLAFFLNQHVERKNAEFLHVGTLRNWADVGTKPMGGSIFLNIAENLFSRL